MTKNNILYIICIIFAFYACSNNDSEGPKNPTGSWLDEIDSKVLTFSYKKGSQTVKLPAGLGTVDMVIGESGKGWCTIESKDDGLTVTVNENEKPEARKTNIAISAKGETATMSVEQKAFDIATITAKIPLGGNSYVTAGASGYIADTGFEGWSSLETVFSTYFRLNQPGDLKLYLQYSVDAENNKIEIKCRENTFAVSLPKPKLNKDTIIYIGSVNNDEAGYIQVDFQGKELKGTVFSKPSNLLVTGKASENMNFVDDFSYYWGRRGPSVHMGYSIPSGVTAEWFYNEITVPEGYDPIGSYFMSNGFAEGYFGMQVNSASERRVLFSVWSPYETDDPNNIPEEQKVKLVKKGQDVRTGEFGNEGSGGQSYWVYDWKAGNTYKFLTHIRPAANGYSEYTSYFFAPELGKWKLIAQFLRPATNTYYVRPHSFLENFSTETGYKTRKAFYNNQWVYTKEGQWLELTNGKFTADNTARQAARMDYKGGADESGFFLQNCGFFSDNTTIDSSFSRTAGNKTPEINWSELE